MLIMLLMLIGSNSIFAGPLIDFLAGYLFKEYRAEIKDNDFCCCSQYKYTCYTSPAEINPSLIQTSTTFLI